MSLFRFYGYKDKVIIPQVAQAEEGFYLDIEPITICSTTDPPRLKELFATGLVAPNPVIPTPERSDERRPGSPILEALRLKTWLSFESEAAMYSVYVHEKTVDYYASGNALNGSWNTERSRQQRFERRDDLSELVALLLADVLSDKKARGQRKVGGLMLLPKSGDS